jgi:sensor histidine kinase YesM
MTSATRRTSILIDREVQGSLLQKIVLHWGLLFLANAVALLIWLSLFESPDGSWQDIFQLAIQRYLPVVIVSLAILPAFLWDTVRLTNRFAGPIRRLRVALSDAAHGRAVAPLNFRSNDYWREIANDFNKLTELSEGQAVQDKPDGSPSTQEKSK